MLTLYITRHAKSSWDDPGQHDHDRPLNERGRRDAPVMADRFQRRGEPVDLLVSSTAARAMATARMFADALGIDHRAIRTEPDLYLADPGTLMRCIIALPNDQRRVMLFGHNPGLTDLVYELANTDLGELPTCATVRIDLNAERWDDVGSGSGSMAWYDTPKQVR